jgi:DNA-binding LytR/AlgR family response regulator
MPLTCIIVEDHALYRDIIIHLVEQEPDLRLIKACASAEEAMDVLQQESIDLIFLDIELPDMNGFGLLSRLKQKPIVIVISGNDKYALQGYDWSVADFLLKPVSSERFRISIDKVLNMKAEKYQHVEVNHHDFVFVKDRKNLLRINFSEVLWIEAQGDYMRIQTKGKFYMAHITLSTLSEKLPPTFLRVHRGFIIATDKIERIEDFTIYINNQPIPVSEGYWGELKKKLNII